MFSDKYTVNLLTSLLIAKGVRQAVLCPGSRDIPLVANFCEADDVECHAVTDERSAAFCALGIALATRQPVALCLTSGSALLNAAPALCEAYYRHVPLVVVSADRPQPWIGRNDGQTMRQHGALAPFVRAQVDLADAEESDDDTCGMQVLQINTALNEALGGERGPVHINLHISEPFFSFNTPHLPTARCIRPLVCDTLGQEALSVARRFMGAPRRMIVVGQLPSEDLETDALLRLLEGRCVVVSECLASSAAGPADSVMGALMGVGAVDDVDFLVSMGGNFIGKNIKRYLRAHAVGEHWEVNADGVAHDTFGAQTGVIRADAKTFLRALLDVEAVDTAPCPALGRWRSAVGAATEAIASHCPAYSMIMAVSELEGRMARGGAPCHVHYANSMAVRVGALYAHHYVWCNRGVNGIEGSLSTAAGFSLATSDKVVCVTGDLSFFYDQNALWNDRLRGNLRILLVNNSGGAIFSQLDGLSLKPETMRFVAGQHAVSARGVCEQHHVEYLQARGADELAWSMDRLLDDAAERPVVLEVFTRTEDDRREYAALAERLKRACRQLIRNTSL